MARLLSHNPRGSTSRGALRPLRRGRGSCARPSVCAASLRERRGRPQRSLRRISQFFTEDNEYFVQGRTELQRFSGISDETVEEILAESIAE